VIRTVACGVLILTALLAAAQSPPKPAPRPHFRISGTVVNAVGGQPLAQVTVFIAVPENPNDTTQVTTGEDGRFLFDNVAPGKYAMSAQRRGFTRQSFQQHELYSTAVAVGPGKVSEDLIFQLSPDASISGTVTDEENEVVTNGRVVLFKSGLEDGTQAVRFANQSQLDEAGHYRFDHLDPGKYYVVVLARPWFAQYIQRSSQRVDSEGHPVAQAPPPLRSDLDVAYQTTFYAQATDSSGASMITVGPGDRFVADVPLTAVPALHIRVVNLVDASNVLLAQPTFDGMKMPIFAETDEVSPGVVEVNGVAPGRYTLNMMSREGDSSDRQDREVDLTGDQEIDASRRPSSVVTIAGTIHVENSKSVPEQLFLRFRNVDSGDSFGGPLSDKGQFEFRHDLSKPGTYEIRLVNQDGTIAVKSITATGAKTVGHNLALNGGSSVRLDILASKGLAHINGIALLDGKPASQCMVMLVPADPANNRVLFRRDQSDSDGTFTLPNVVPGKYSVIALQNGWNLEWSNPAVLEPYLKDAQPLFVDSPRTYDVKVNAR
jgi:hypothetical protein